MRATSIFGFGWVGSRPSQSLDSNSNVREASRWKTHIDAISRAGGISGNATTHINWNWKSSFQMRKKEDGRWRSSVSPFPLSLVLYYYTTKDPKVEDQLPNGKTCALSLLTIRGRTSKNIES